ncbi:MAG: thioredoxin [Chlamydiales bacterium]|nr:thioredoxin [Chlamydiales bacterium]
MKKSLLLFLTIACSHLFGHVQSITSEEQLNATTASGMVLVDFYASWCGPCKQLAPVLDKLSDEMQGKVVFAKVDSDALRAVSKKLGVTALPTVILYRDGKEVRRFTGFKDGSAIKALIGAS